MTIGERAPFLTFLFLFKDSSAPQGIFSSSSKLKIVIFQHESLQSLLERYKKSLILIIDLVSFQMFQKTYQKFHFVAFF